MSRTLPPKMNRLPVNWAMIRTSSGKEASSRLNLTRKLPGLGMYSTSSGYCGKVVVSPYFPGGAAGCAWVVAGGGAPGATGWVPAGAPEPGGAAGAVAGGAPGGGCCAGGTLFEAFGPPIRREGGSVPGLGPGAPAAAAATTIEAAATKAPREARSALIVDRRECQGVRLRQTRSDRNQL